VKSSIATSAAAWQRVVTNAIVFLCLGGVPSNIDIKSHVVSARLLPLVGIQATVNALLQNTASQDGDSIKMGFGRQGN